MFAKEGYPTMALATAIVAVIVYLSFNFINHWVAYLIEVVFIVLWGIVIYFFRDPERISPNGENLVISPADGKVVLIKEIQQDVYLAITNLIKIY